MQQTYLEKPTVRTDDAKNDNGKDIEKEVTTIEDDEDEQDVTSNDKRKVPEVDDEEIAVFDLDKSTQDLNDAMDRRRDGQKDADDDDEVMLIELDDQPDQLPVAKNQRDEFRYQNKRRSDGSIVETIGVDTNDIGRIGSSKRSSETKKANKSAEEILP